MLCVGMRLIYVKIYDIRDEGDEVVSESIVYIDLPLIDSFLFEFLFA